MPKERPSFETRFWSKVRKGRSTHCWLWVGSIHEVGYGRIRRNNKIVYTHRAVWELTYGPIPKGAFVCHHCDVRHCVRPSHLFLGDLRSNAADRNKKGRQAKGERVHTAKLSRTQRDDIRRLRLEGLTLESLGKRFGVNHSTIWALLSDKSWISDR